MTAVGKRLMSVMGSLALCRRYIPVGLTLCTGFGLSILASATVWTWETRQVKMEFQRQADTLATALQRSVNDNFEVFLSIQALYNASGEVERQQFKKFVQPALSRHSAIHSINWAKRLPATHRQAYEQATQAEGIPNFQIYDRGSAGEPVRSKQRQEYFPVTYREAQVEDSKVLGFDLASNPPRKAALEKSRDTGTVVASGRIKLVSNNQSGLQLFLPVYRYDTPQDTVQNRRENLRGFVGGILQISDIVKSSIKGLKLDNINFYLYDNSATGKERFLVRYDSSTKQLIDDPNLEQPTLASVGGELCTEQTACRRTFTIADRQWLLIILPTPAYAGIATHQGALAILAIGLLMTGSLVIYLLMSLERTAQVEHQVHVRTNELKERKAELETALQNLQKAQSQLIQTEKLSSLGQLVAGVAHEINNPVNFIYGNLRYADEYIQDLLELLDVYQQQYPNPTPEVQAKAEDIELEFLVEDLPKILASMNVGAERIRQIVLSLRVFSRLDEAEMKSVDIHDGLDSTLLILQHRLKARPDHPVIEVIKEYGDLPLVECYAGQLNQVFMNILSNAIDALDSYNQQRSAQDIHNHPSRIKICTEVLQPDRVTVRIADNGPGMTEKVKQRLFEPFFTTKPVGQGTGLGLSISYQIVVEKHKGALWCVSAPGLGTEFWIEIPLRQSCEQSASTVSQAASMVSV